MVTMAQKSMSKQEKQWQAEDDARTLTRYAEIQADEGRLEAAQKLLEEQAENIKYVLDQTTKATGII
jgi:D-serine dehydratase